TPTTDERINASAYIAERAGTPVVVQRLHELHPVARVAAGIREEHQIPGRCQKLRRNEDRREVDADERVDERISRSAMQNDDQRITLGRVVTWRRDEKAVDGEAPVLAPPGKLFDMAKAHWGQRSHVIRELRESTAGAVESVEFLGLVGILEHHEQCGSVPGDRV